MSHIILFRVSKSAHGVKDIFSKQKASLLFNCINILLRFPVHERVFYVEFGLIIISLKTLFDYWVHKIVRLFFIFQVLIPIILCCLLHFSFCLYIIHFILYPSLLTLLFISKAYPELFNEWYVTFARLCIAFDIQFNLSDLKISIQQVALVCRQFFHEEILKAQCEFYQSEIHIQLHIRSLKKFKIKLEFDFCVKLNWSVPNYCIVDIFIKMGVLQSSQRNLRLEIELVYKKLGYLLKSCHFY